MAEKDSTNSPLEAAAGAAGQHATDAFALLGNETRLAVLLALWEEYQPDENDNALPFSALHEHVGYDNPGNFSYHLEKLKGQFIQQSKAGDGYELRTAGLKVVQSVIAGAGVAETRLERTEIPLECSHCGASTAVLYEDETLFHVCTACEGNISRDDLPDGQLNAMRVDPAALTGRSPEELLAVAGVTAYRHMRTMFEGLCSACSGPIDASLSVCADHDAGDVCGNCGRKHAIETRFQCRVCKDAHATTPTMLVLFHPATVAFYHEHGVSTRWHADDFESITRTMKLVTDHEMAVVSEDPPRVAVTVSRDGDKLRLVFDETATVVDVDE